MNAIPTGVSLSEVEVAIHRLALSLDAFLVNGIPIGVLYRLGDGEFLQKTAGNLLRELASLEAAVAQGPAKSKTNGGLLAPLGACVHQLIDRVTGLSEFRSLPRDQLRSTVSEIPRLRAECVRQIEDLEGLLQTPNLFYPSRPAHSAEGVNAFLDSLERLFAEEWGASHKSDDRG